MKYSFLPVEKRGGQWRVKWWTLIAWTLVVNLVGFLVVVLLQPPGPPPTP